MNSEWSLEVYYKGYEDPAFAEDFELLQKNAQALETVLEQAREQDDVQGLVTVLEAKEAYAKVLFKLNEYLGLRNSVDTTDGKTLDYIGRLDKINASTAKAQSAMDKYIAGVADLEACIAAHPLLTEYAFLLRNTKKNAVHLFSDEMEAMISKMNLSGGNAWGRLFDYLTSTCRQSEILRVIQMEQFVRNLIRQNLLLMQRLKVPLRMRLIISRVRCVCWRRREAMIQR